MSDFALFIPAEKFIHFSNAMPDCPADTDWVFSGCYENSLSVEIPALPPRGCCGWKVELCLKSDPKCPASSTDVFAGAVICDGNTTLLSPVRSFVNAGEGNRKICLTPCVRLEPEHPAILTVTRKTADPADSYPDGSVFSGAVITAVAIPEEPETVINTPGYNSWPMCQFFKDRLVCTYSRGSAHEISEPNRAVFAKIADRSGIFEDTEYPVCNTPGRGDVPIGKGIDENGDMLLWVRHCGAGYDFRHRLYRTTDGKNYECIAEPDLPEEVIQITDVFHVPGVGLMALYFAGHYREDRNYWGKLTSSDNGKTWINTVIEKDLPRREWPTEPSAVYLGNGRILVIARIETNIPSTDMAQFQIVSTDNGETWKKSKTNITDVRISTPSLIYDPEKDMVSNYYFHRGRGILNCRKAKASYIFDHPLEWQAPETIALGGMDECEAGNVNACGADGKVYISWYSGIIPDTGVYVKTL